MPIISTFLENITFLIYFWYRNDIIQEQLDNIKAKEEESHRQYQIEQQQKREEESKKLKEQFGKQTI